MMYVTGIPCVVIVRVKNSTAKKIPVINITYDQCRYGGIKIKNIKPNDLKQGGISTINIQRHIDLKIYINEEKKYLIKEKVGCNDRSRIRVEINNIYDDGTIDYIVSDIED